jgi:hypothetical protein
MYKLKQEIGIDADVLLNWSNSQAGQDLFVICLMQGKRQGRWLELGAGMPKGCNNTYLLEKHFDWSGNSIELLTPTWSDSRKRWRIFYKNVKDCFNGQHPSDWIDDPEDLQMLPQHIQDDFVNIHGYHTIMADTSDHPNILLPENDWSIQRPNANFIVADAARVDYSKLTGPYDYLQVDIDHAHDSLKCLQSAVVNHEFAVVTFEHDYFRFTLENDYCRSESRKIMHDHGYMLLANDVTCEPDHGWTIDNRPIYFEDWYVHPDKVDLDTIKRYLCITTELRPKYYQEILFDRM